MRDLVNKIKLFFSLQRINTALSRASAAIPLRNVNPGAPNSWEFSGFSQNGEDGIVDFLSRKTIKPNRYFIEIGSANGFENNTSWLAIVRKYSGLMVESRRKAAELCRLIMSLLNIGVECKQMFITRENIEQFLGMALYLNPDVFSLDMDGVDYYIAKAVMDAGFRPKIFIVEYNSTFGPGKSITIKYNENFNHYKAHDSFLYYGVSISGWKKLFKSFNYKFVTVDLNGVNAFFINQECFEKDFIDNLNGLEFQENFFQLKKFKMPWDKQFKLIESLNFEII